MRFTDIIEKKMNGMALSKEEINMWISGYVSGNIPDYQVSALLMAICLKGMNREEVTDLTMAMMNSGDVMKLSEVRGVKVDKHSTGGVGDKTSLVLGPMAAACGLSVVKMSGRGLGFTGGTIDKLESIDGFRADLGGKEFTDQVNRIGIAIVSQSGNLVPADKKLYALRDVTGTVSSIPLIASSIMSKKLASGADVIVLDVKFGSGAFMKTPEEARELAKLMIDIGTGAGRRVRALISSMESPLGYAIGNALEVEEAVHCLRGEGPEDLRELCVALGSLMMEEAESCAKDSHDCSLRRTEESDTMIPYGHKPEDFRRMMSESLENGTALEKFADMVCAQGGSREEIMHPENLVHAPLRTQIISDWDGYIRSEEAVKLGKLAMELGAGRSAKDEDIMPDVGIVLAKKPGEHVCRGDVLATAHHRTPLKREWIRECKDSFDICADVPDIGPLIREIL